MGIHVVRFNRKGQSLLTWGNDHSIWLWDYNGHQLQKFEAYQGYPVDMQFSPDVCYFVAVFSDGMARTRELIGARPSQEVSGGDFGSPRGTEEALQM